MNPTIRKYLFALCFVFSTCLLGVSVFLVQALSTGVKAVEQETRFFNALDQANEARSEFYNLRYWLTELSVSLLMQSERNADTAYKRFDKSIKSLPGVDSATISTIRTKTNLMVKIAKRAVESYSKDQRVLGNSSMAQTRVHAALVEAEFHKLVSSLKQQAVLARNQTIQGASRAEYLAYIVVALFSIIGFVFTIYLIRSITTPLSHIQDSIREMTAGNLDTKLPESPLGEIGDMTRALRLLRDAELGRLKADEANRAKSTFLAVMSHELRTPMHGILGNASLLLESNLPGQQRKYVDTIKQSGDVLLGLLNNILDISKIEEGHVDLEIVDFRIADVIDEVVALLQSRAQQKGLKFSVEYDTELPSVVLGDPERIRQVLVNLIGNAIKFTQQGWVAVRLSHAELDGDKFEIRFEISDSGIGLSPDQQSLVFERFAQADESTTRRFGGTGLGLSICNDLVRLMGGKIGVESALGVGSKFWFSLPCHLGEEKRVDKRNGIDLHADRANKFDLPPLRILVAEDNLVNQEIVKDTLENENHDVFIVSNGADAVQAVKESSFDLVLMDIQMPEMDGIHAARAIRQLPGDKNDIPIVALTANARTEDMHTYLEAGMDDYVSKPFEFQDLFAAMLRCLKKKDFAASSGHEISSAEQAQHEIARGIDPVLADAIRIKKPELWKRIVGIYLKTTPGDLEILGDALINNDRAALKNKAHAMASAGANIGATAMSQLCRTMEVSAEENEIGELQKLQAQIMGEYDQIVADLKAGSEDRAAT